MPESKRSSQTTLLGKLRDFLNTPLPGAPRPKPVPERAEALLAETPPSGPVETLVMTDTLDVVEAPTSPEMLTEITNSDASLSVPSVSEALLINEAETLTAEPIEAAPPEALRTASDGETAAEEHQAVLADHQSEVEAQAALAGEQVELEQRQQAEEERRGREAAVVAATAANADAHTEAEAQAIAASQATEVEKMAETQLVVAKQAEVETEAIKATEVEVAEVQPSVAEAPATTETEVKTPRTYVVKAEDNLSWISEQVYGTPRRWRDIFDANRDTISTPSQINVGQELIIPE